ncbi:hypothetical protein DSM104443_02459 [Usitatibacter rugosus]|uniref:J domain-containing protein n=1 Tax=Usitatibacter rugosus TaxID=2732067 RepID=A0A6M4GY09_9PROT|nr:trypsin-like peptidase domain-containing protein [Usitatibacter rugosus]QJR11384.1 hypothetical protein DSM104443_02459 [Usitatibacter rugosus]
MPVPDYYEILGVPRRAKLTDITRAHKRWVAEFKKESTAPDPRREALLLEAFETLSDEHRRDAYDAELAAFEREIGRKKNKPPVAAIAAGVLVVAAGAAFFGFRSSGPPAPTASTTESLQMAMSGSVSPLLSYDISGKSTPAGLAFVIEDKVMVGNCQGLAPGALLVVNVGKGRTIPARVTIADDALGLCKILTDGYVGQPLSVNSTPPAVGANVFSAVMDAKGELGIRETKVTKVVDEGKGKAIQAAITTQPGGNGAPLLDAQGKVVAVATLQADGSTLHRVIPAGWLAENRPQLAEPKPYQDSGGAAKATGTAGATTDQGAANLLGQKPANWEEMGPDEREQWERGQAEIQRRQGAIIKGMGGKK